LLQRESGEAESRESGGITLIFFAMRNCKWCGKEFDAKGGQTHDSYYCCQKCIAEAKAAGKYP